MFAATRVVRTGPAMRVDDTDTPTHRLEKVAGIAACAALVLVLAGCRTTRPGSSEDAMLEYREVAERLEADGTPLVRESEAERRAIERFQSLLADFKAPDFRERIRTVYAEELFFDDTLRTIRSLDELEEYLAESADAVDLATVDFLGMTVDDGNYFFRWQMNLDFRRFGGDRIHSSVGMSHIRFDADGRVVLHKDFWDSTSGLFEHVPGLGWMLRRVKSRL